jgi:hypothetical protein
VIAKHGEVVDEFEVDPALADRHVSAHVTSTSANEFLPPNFIEQNTKNKPLWWVNRFIYGSCLYAEGLVYPAAMRCIVDDFDIPLRWKRIAAFDYGLADDAVFLFCAIDEEKGIVYAYKEVRVNNKNVEELSKLFIQAAADIPTGGFLTTPLIDPKSGVKRDYDKKTLIDHFLDYNVSFKPGQVNVDARIFRLNTYLESGKFKTFRSLTALNRELANYKFQADESVLSGYKGKPIDKDNHGINCAEWITMELPSDPKNLLFGIYDRFGRDISKPSDPEREYGMMALNDDESEFQRSYRETPFEIETGYNYF